MTIEGYIENGGLVLSSPITLSDGTRVTVLVEPLCEEPAKAGEKFPSLYERMKPVIGKAKGLPSDLANNHDHYLHGQAKRQ